MVGGADDLVLGWKRADIYSQTNVLRRERETIVSNGDRRVG